MRQVIGSMYCITYGENAFVTHKMICSQKSSIADRRGRILARWRGGSSGASNTKLPATSRFLIPDVAPPHLICDWREVWPARTRPTTAKSRNRSNDLPLLHQLLPLYCNHSFRPPSGRPSSHQTRDSAASTTLISEMMLTVSNVCALAVGKCTAPSWSISSSAGLRILCSY
jgi:hypothetical protein